MNKFNKEVNLKESKDRDRQYTKFDENQKQLFKSIKDNIFTFCSATSGSGKTLVSLASMVDLLANNEIDKIIYCRLVSRRDLKVGFLPGSLEEKSYIMWQPAYDSFLTLGIQPEAVDSLREQELLYFSTDVGMRGVNFERCGIIIDEGQNCEFSDLKLILTRAHDSCKICLCGDVKQNDNNKNSSAFIQYGEYLSSAPFGNKCELVNNYRGKLSRWAEDFEMRKDD
jgi:phosphate starvation-inducible protein PhoH